MLQIKSRQRVASHGEVFTGEREVKAMCDLVADECLRIDSRFLEPACGEGNFLAEILQRKLAVVEDKYRRRPCDWERNSLLALGSLYGVDILADNCAHCRKRLYEIWETAYQAVCKKECSDGTHRAAQFILARNIVCGNALSLHCVDEAQNDTNIPIVFSEWTFPQNDEFLRRKDYTFDELLNGKEAPRKAGKQQPMPGSDDRRGTFVQEYVCHYRRLGEEGAAGIEGAEVSEDGEPCRTYDVVISNPPYQLSDGGNAASALPIYQKFVQQAQKLRPRYLSMIIPARWYTGGRGLDTFRNDMLNDDRIRVLHDYPDASDCFPGVEIKGGVCYFLWDRDSRGLCQVYTHRGQEVDVSRRPLLEPGMKIFLRNDVQISVLRKVRSKGEPSFADYLHAGRYFGFHTRVDWLGDGAGRLQTADGKDFLPVRDARDERYNVKVFIHGGACWIPLDQVPRNQEKALCWKVLLPRSGNPRGTVIGCPKLSPPCSCSSNTYVVVLPPTGAFTQEEAEYCVSYIRTKFFRYMVAIQTSTQDTPPKAYQFVPVQDFSRPWTDEQLYEKYGLTQRERQAIEDAVAVMKGE